MLKIVLAIVLLLSVPAAAATTKKPPVIHCRDAKTGVYVSQKYAKKYPGLTVCEEVKTPPDNIAPGVRVQK